MGETKKQELDKFSYQGILQNEVKFDFGNHTVTLEPGVEYVIFIAKKADD